VYELRPALVTIGGAIGIPSNGLRLLGRLGVYDTLARLGCTRDPFILHSTKDTVLAESDFSGEAKERIGYGYMRIKRRDLVSGLLEAVQKQKTPVHYGKHIVSIEEGNDGVTATFADGTRDTADILLGCDGIHSSVRSLRVDPQLQPEYSGISAIFSLLPRSALPADAPPVTCLNSTLTTDGVFALMPCTPSSDEMFWFFSREVPIPQSGDTRDGWEEHRQKEVEGFKTALLDVLSQVQGRWGDFLRGTVQQTTSVAFFPIYRLPLGGKWSRGRCQLLGDAAHAMQPHAGQGVSMALEDIFVFSRVLKHWSDRPVADVFAKYDEIRRPRIARIYNNRRRMDCCGRKRGPGVSG
jgi:2-polyprenyl-6-methoxyphenol hydroxylase-like FAD-dependent oxidoreductase